jgi:hypothetical protein
LPPTVDFEPVFGNPSGTTANARQDAWTLLPVIRTFIRRLTATFGTPPFFYSGAPYFQSWYPVTKLGMAKERPDATWDDDWLDPIFGCRVWHAEYPNHASPTSNPGANNGPWPRPAGYTGNWFPAGARWDIFQFGVARAHGIGALAGADAQPQGSEATDPSWPALPEADAASFGTLGHGAGIQLDLDVWNGSLPELVDVALQTRWNPDG